MGHGEGSRFDRSVVRGVLLLEDVDVVEVGCDLELVFGQRGLHRLPLGGGLDDLPVAGRAYADRHGKVLFVSAPLIHDHSGSFAEEEFEAR